MSVRYENRDEKRPRLGTERGLSRDLMTSQRQVRGWDRLVSRKRQITHKWRWKKAGTGV